MNSRNASTSIGAGISESLHDHGLVHPELRDLFQEIILHSLTERPPQSTDLPGRREPPLHHKLTIEGTFIPLNDREFCARWSDAGYCVEQLRYMRGIGINTLIILTGNPEASATTRRFSRVTVKTMHSNASCLHPMPWI